MASGESDSSLTTLLLMQSLGGGQNADMSKLLPLLLLKGNKGDGLESLLLMQALGLNLGNLSASSLSPSFSKPGLPTPTKTTYGEGKAVRSPSADKV
jgi:hypothetical protein